MLSYYPEFLGVAGHIAAVPFGLAIMGILLHFLSISGYWYGWDRLPPRTHLAFGIGLNISSLLIPLEFRAVFAFLNIPQGLEFVEANGAVKPTLNVLAALANPTLPPLYLKSIGGAIALGATATAAALVVRASYRDVPLNLYMELAKRFTSYALPATLFTALMGAWYYLSLQAIPCKFNNINGPLAWLLGLKIALALAQIALLYIALKKLKSQEGYPRNELLGATIAGMIVLLGGEYLNAFSQYPYFIAAATDPKLVSAIPEPWRTTITRVVDLRNVNTLALEPVIQGLTVTLLGGLLVALVYFLYLILTPTKQTTAIEKTTNV